MTTTTAPATEGLDVLDDPLRHASCDRCYPRPPALGDPFTAWCGARALWLYTPPITHRHEVPPDPCEPCRDLPACQTCGWTG